MTAHQRYIYMLTITVTAVMPDECISRFRFTVVLRITRRFRYSFGSFGGPENMAWAGRTNNNKRNSLFYRADRYDCSTWSSLFERRVYLPVKRNSCYKVFVLCVFHFLCFWRLWELSITYKLHSDVWRWFVKWDFTAWKGFFSEFALI